MEQIPFPAKERLLHLMRLLENCTDAAVTSARIEAMTGWASHTVRKDISFLGAALENREKAQAMGSSGGYDPAALIPAIKKALGLEKRRKFCVVGLGRLGSAYLNLPELEGGEFVLAAGFDTNVNRTEILKSPVPLYPAYKMAEVIGRFGIDLALLCVPREAAQASAEKLAAAGIRGILNFVPVVLALPPDVAVKNVYVRDELLSLTIKMAPDARGE